MLDLKLDELHSDLGVLFFFSFPLLLVWMGGGGAQGRRSGGQWGTDTGLEVD